MKCDVRCRRTCFLVMTSSTLQRTLVRLTGAYSLASNRELASWMDATPDFCSSVEDASAADQPCTIYKSALQRGRSEVL